MSTVVELQESRQAYDRVSERPLDEIVWQQWMAKRAVQDRSRSAARMQAVKWVLIVGLLTLAVLWSRLTPYEVVIKFAVAAGAIVLMCRALLTRQYAFAAVFGVLALIYNPLVPVFSFSGDWQRAFVAASAAPFIASLASRNARLARND